MQKFPTALTNRMQHRTRRITHDDQVGSVPAMQDWFNGGKSIKAIHPINGLKKKKKSHNHINR